MTVNILRKAVASAIYQNNDLPGMTAHELLDWVESDTGVQAISDVLAEMQADGEVEDTGKTFRRGTHWYPIYRLTAQGIDHHLPDRCKPKQRKCLGCGNQFMSEHAGNRRCGSCSDLLAEGLELRCNAVSPASVTEIASGCQKIVEGLVSPYRDKFVYGAFNDRFA